MLIIIALVIGLFLFFVYRCEKIVAIQKQLNTELDDINDELTNIKDKIEDLNSKMEELL